MGASCDDNISRNASNGKGNLEAALILTSIIACSSVAYAIGYTKGFREGYTQAESYFSKNSISIDIASSNKFENAYKP
jgi:hypothetical protein